MEQGYQVFYLTNNSGKTQQQIIDKLNGFGFRANLQNTYCGSYAISCYLLQEKIMSVYLVGTDALMSDLESHDIKVDNSADVSAVVVGLDPFLSYNKIATALEAINNGAKLIIANMDPSYPVENDRRLPGCGAMVGAIVGATGHAPDFHVGKPNTYMFELLCNKHGLSPQEICVIGDDPESDIKMAVTLQCQSILFDPKDTFQGFPGNKVRYLQEITSLINKKGGLIK